MVKKKKKNEAAAKEEEGLEQRRPQVQRRMAGPVLIAGKEWVAGEQKQINGGGRKGLTITLELRAETLIQPNSLSLAHLQVLLAWNSGVVLNP